MADQQEKAGRQDKEAGRFEQRGATEWIAAGSAALSAATQAYQVIKGGSDEKPPSDGGNQKG